MIRYTIAESTADLNGILSLQKANLPQSISADEAASQGFVTVDHSYDQLKRLNEIEAHVIAKEDEKVVAYLLVMTPQSSTVIPILVPMFETFSRIMYNGKLICEYNYLVVGQVCVGKSYRGSGILKECYRFYRKHFSGRYDFAITEIDLANTRSLRAHEKIGFTVIHQYNSDNRDWCIVLWDWSEPAE